MGRVRFVRPEVVRIPLSDDDWIEVRKDLNNGESKRLESAGMRPHELPSGKTINLIDWERYDLERAMIFLTDWSFKGFDDKHVELSLDALKALDPADFNEIHSAITAHIIKRAAEKKALRAASPEIPPVTNAEATS